MTEISLEDVARACLSERNLMAATLSARLHGETRAQVLVEAAEAAREEIGVSGDEAVALRAVDACAECWDLIANVFEEAGAP